MNLDWFLMLTPILLLPLFLLLSFTGCTVGESSRPQLTFVLHDNLSLPSLRVTKVYFSWITDGFPADPVVVEQPQNPDEQILEFRYQPEKTEVGQLWTVSCSPFSDTINLAEATCGPFELTAPTGEYSVKFEIIADTQGGGRVQVSPGGCPMPS